MKKFITLVITLVTLAALLTACAREPAAETAAETVLPKTEAAESLPAADFGSLQKLLGLEDEEAAEYFGGGSENWTADKSAFIGRIYQVSLLDHPATVYTSCNNENKVASVSAWVADGSREVAEEDVLAWVQRINDYAQSDPIYDSASSEAGSRNWKWQRGDVFISLHWLGDILTIELLPAIGELH